MNTANKFVGFSVGLGLIFVGLIILLATESSDTYQIIPVNSGSSRLKVKQAKGEPEATTNYLQGSKGLQNQGSQPQSSNAGSALQPNAGSDSLPASY